MPIRRNTKDPAYLITLKAYVAELLHTHDLFFYPEGGRSYSGELKHPKTGLFSACLQRRTCRACRSCRWRSSYDLVLEDHVLARQKVKRRQRAFSREVAEMVRYAVGYAAARSSRSAGRSRSTATTPNRARSVLDWRTRCSAKSAGSTRCCRRRWWRRRCARTSHAPISRIASTAILDSLPPGANLARALGRRGAGGGHRAAPDPRHHRRRRRPLPRPRPQRPALLRPQPSSTCSRRRRDALSVRSVVR